MTDDDDDDLQLNLPFPDFWFECIDDNYIYQSKVSSKKTNGLNCKKCKEFFNYAESNQEDGTLICWGCRNNY
jgi:formylmethanofuran dehydrogenase subunit E